jgi:superfamily I DNA/RNA helicase
VNVSKYILLLNAEAKSHFLSRSDQEKKRLREKLEFLENGLWDAGVRVKKLKGVSNRVVFEARLSRSDRILFTLGRHDRGAAIYIWGVSGHDKLGATLRKTFPRNAPFLEFEPEAREDFRELSIDDLPAAYFSTENIETKSPEDCGPQKWLVLTDEQWRRILLSSEADAIDLFLLLTSEQEEVLRRDPPLLLAGTAGSGKTTIAVYYLLRKEFLEKRRIFLTYSPFLKRFSEQIYDGLIKNADHGKLKATRPDFYVFRDLLADILKAHGSRYDKEKEVGLGEFERIFRNHRLHRKYDAVLVWEEIRAIIKGAKSPVYLNRYKKLVGQCGAGEVSRNEMQELKEYLLSLKNLEVIQKIEKLVVNKSGYASYDDFLLEVDTGNAVSRSRTLPVLHEILRIIEKKTPSLSDPLLTFQEYMALGKKRAPNFLYDRREIYTIAEYYQEKLEADGLWDEIDLCKRALQLLRGTEDRFIYDLVVCDEVQDFSDIQIALIFRLSRSGHNVFLTGDPKQIINPSGFRWEEVKNKFYDRGMPVPDLLKLNLNFRCVGNIVKLANALLDLKQKLVGLSDTEMREDWKFNGRPPFLLHGMNEQEVMNGIRLAGAGRIVLVRNRPEQDKLKKALKTELVFTINDAKGLEFDTVFLWKIGTESGSSDLWRRIHEGEALDRRHHPHLKHELNLLYVAVTRARNTLVIYDGEAPSRVWGLEALRDKLYRTSEKVALSEIWQRASSPEEWEQQGDYFFEREYYPAAMECYKNGGNQKKKEVAQAFVLERDNRHAEAAQLFEKHHHPARAAENFEKSYEYERAMGLWVSVGNNDRAGLCRIWMYESQGRHDEAAREWMKLGEEDKALECWGKANNHEEIACYYVSRNKLEKAAAFFEKAKRYEDAASCYKKAKKYTRAADLYFRVKDYKNAAILYKRLKHKDNLLQCHLAMEDYHSAALLYEKDKHIDKAIESFKRFSEGSQENTDLLRLEASKHSGHHMTLKAALRYSALAMYEFSAPFYYRKGYVDRALEEYRVLGDHARLADCLEEKGRFYEAAAQVEQEDSQDKWEKVTRLLQHHVYGREAGRASYYLDHDKKRADMLYQEAEAFLRAGSYEKALARFHAIRYPEGILQAFLKLGRDEEAIRFFVRNQLVDYAGRYLQEKHEADLSLDLLKDLTREYSRVHIRYKRGIQEDLNFLARAFESRLKMHGDDETSVLLDDFLSEFEYYHDFEEIIPVSLLDLALGSRCYNAVFRAAAANRYARNRLSEKIRSFFDSVKAEAERHGDRNLLASYCFLYDEPAYELILQDLSLTPRNYTLFSESRLHYRKTVDYLMGEKRVEGAAALCKMHEDFVYAAMIYEGLGDLKTAGRDYREAKKYEDALRCYREAKDSPNVARVYERMKDFDKAIKVWSDLGRPREVMRIQKKLAKLKQKASQPRLL